MRLRHSIASRFVVALAAALSSAASGHDFWIMPGSFRPKVDAPLGVDILTGHGGTAEVRARDARRIVKFVCAGPSGTSDVAGIDGRPPAGLVRPAAPGIHVIGYQSTHATSELPPEKFESYLREEGLDRIVEDRAARGATSTTEREIYLRCAKSIVRAESGGGPAGSAGPATDSESRKKERAQPGAGANSSGTDSSGRVSAGSGDAGAAAGAEPPIETRPLGLRLELVPLALPAAVGGTEAVPWRIRLLYEGQAVEGVRVALKEPMSGVVVSAARTAADGTVAFTVPRSGPWLVTAVHMVRAPDGADAVWESMWASLTLAVDAR